MNRIPIRKFCLSLGFASIVVPVGTYAQAQATLNVYGPGGPAPVMKEAAATFQKKTGIAVNVTAGPTPAWIDKAKENADVIYSGSEVMMTDFTDAVSDQLSASAVEPLYLRPAAMLVRPGNPKQIRHFTDLLKPGVKVLVVNGSGQGGLWEDVAGRMGDIEQVKALRSNIVNFAKNSAVAKQTWTDQTEIDVWLIWNIWQVANPSLADVVPIEPKYAIYRDTGVAITRHGAEQPASKQFVDFLKSKDGAAIFAKWGWKVPANTRALDRAASTTHG
jgi:accessory colonization factor AcfC